MPTLRALDPRRAVAGARTRVLPAFVVLLALSTVVSTLAPRRTVLARAGERVEQSLIPEVEELERRGRIAGTTSGGSSTSSAIAEAHGGRVELDSREGAGSTFTLVIPAERELQEVT